MIIACFLVSLSTRKVAIALLLILGRPVSPATLSAMAGQLDAASAAFYRRPTKDIYRVLVLDGVVLRRKTGTSALALVALGLRPDGKKQVIDFRLATAESAAQWEQFLGDLVRRGLTGERLEMLCVDGGSGLLAALPTACPHTAAPPPHPLDGHPSGQDLHEAQDKAFMKRILFAIFMHENLLESPRRSALCDGGRSPMERVLKGATTFRRGSDDLG